MSPLRLILFSNIAEVNRSEYKIHADNQGFSDMKSGVV